MKPSPHPTKGMVVCAMPDFVAHVGKAGVTVIVEEHLVVIAEVGDEEVDQTVIFVVADSDAHGSDLASVRVQCETRQVAVVLKGSVALVDVEIVGL